MTANRSEGGMPSIDSAIAECGLVTRPYLDVAVRHVPVSAHAFLGALIAGTTLGDGIESALALDPGFDLTANLQCLLEAGVFTSVY